MFLIVFYLNLSYNVIDFVPFYEILLHVYIIIT